MSAWQTFRQLPFRRKVLVAIAAPLWLPVAFTAWLAVTPEDEQ